MPKAKTTTEGTETPSTPKNITKVTFKLLSGRTREFTEAEHGEDFLSIADEFAKNNADVNVGAGNRIDKVVDRIDS